MEKMNLITKDVSLTRKNITPKKVTLIACPWTFYEEVEFISQQLGLGYVGAYAQQFGHKIQAYIDPMLNGGAEFKVPINTKYQHTNRFGFPDEWIVSQIPSDTDIIGINAPFTDSRLVLYPLVKKIKAKFPNTPVVIGGVLPTTLPMQVLTGSGADIVVKGEGEVAFSRILNDDPLESIPGLVFRKSDGTIFEAKLRSQQLKTVDMIPPPGYDFRPMEEYVKWSPRGNKADRTLSLISSRGCPFTCEFCSIPEKGQLWRPFTPERVLDEIKMAIEKWGVNHIEFEDDNFTLKEPRALTVLEYIRDLRNKGHDVFCSFPNGVMIDKMSRELAILMKEAGTEIAYLPVESGDTRVLISMDKPVAEKHLAQALEVAEWCVDAKLFVSCFFITAYPGGRLNPRFKANKKFLEKHKKYLLYDGEDIFMRGEDEESFEITLEFCRKLKNLGVQGITPLIATPYPGTELYEVCEKFDWLRYKDEQDVLTTVSYAAVTADRVQISTPWCSHEEAFKRWQIMMDMFPTYHNVRKNENDPNLMPGNKKGQP